MINLLGLEPFDAGVLYSGSIGLWIDSILEDCVAYLACRKQ